MAIWMSALFVTHLTNLCMRALAVSSEEPKNVEAEAGKDCELTCHSHKRADIQVIQWNRPDLELKGYVFLYQKKHLPYYQHPSFIGRVQLKDPEMKDGDVSVILKNVNINDTGSYECHVLISNIRRTKRTTDIKHLIHLTVKEPGDKEGGDKEGGDKEGGDKDGNMRGHVGLIAGLIPAGVIVVAVILMIHKTDLKKNSHLVQSVHRSCDPSSNCHRTVVEGFECSEDPESCVVGSEAPGRVSHGKLVPGDETDQEQVKCLTQPD